MFHEGDTPQTPQRQKLLYLGPFQILPYVTLYLAVQCFPWFHKPLQKIIESEEVLREILNL